MDVKVDYAKNEVKSFEAPKPITHKSDINKEELNEIRVDFFSKLTDIQTQVSIISQNLNELKNNQVIINESEIIGKILQKIPTPQLTSSISINKDEIIKDILSRIPQSGKVVYEINPIEKIKKDFLNEAKNKILNDISNLSEESKKMLRYIESRGIGIPVNELCIKCFLMKSGQGGYFKQVNEYGKNLIEISVTSKHNNGKYQPKLKDRIIELVKVHDATDQEIQNVYDHIIMEMLT